MNKLLFLLSFLFSVSMACAQEKVMNILKTDGTTTQTRVADLNEINFLTLEDGGKGLIVKTIAGESVAVLFEANPVVTISSGKLIVKSDSAAPVEVEISDIAEIVFGDASDALGISVVKDFSCILIEGGALLRNIPQGVSPRVYSIDGRNLPTPPVSGGEMRLDRNSLGKGVFIVKVGTFSTKIKL